MSGRVEMESEWEKFRNRIVNLQSYLSWFKVDFFDRDEFREFTHNLSSRIQGDMHHRLFL